MLPKYYGNINLESVKDSRSINSFIFISLILNRFQSIPYSIIEEMTIKRKMMKTYIPRKGRKRSSLIYNTSAVHEQHECDTSDTNAAR